MNTLATPRLARAKTLVRLLLSCSVLLQACNMTPAAAPSAATQPLAAPMDSPADQTASKRTLVASEVTTKDFELGAATGSEAPPTSIGAIRWPVELDADGDDATNPLPGRRVPVLAVRYPSGTNDDLFMRVSLGAQVIPQRAGRNPAGELVEFRVWSDDGTYDKREFALTDAWGAAAVEVTLDARTLRGPLHYVARADNFGETERRSFSVDAGARISEMRIGGARMTASVDASGFLSVVIDSDMPIGQSDDAASINLVRVVTNTTGSDAAGPQQVMQPVLWARRIAERRAEASIYLEPGDYLLVPEIHTERQVLLGSAVAIRVADAAVPEPAQIDEVYAEDETTGQSFVQYYDSDGRLARASLPSQTVARLQSLSPGKPTIFHQAIRTGAFAWRHILHTPQLIKAEGDGKKIITLEDLSYDPVARAYDIRVRSLMTHTVQDTMTVQALGPNNVVIYEQTFPITLDPSEPYRYTFRVPADRGAVKGINVVVHDPASFLADIIDFASAYDPFAYLSKYIKKKQEELGKSQYFQLSPNVTDFGVLLKLETDLKLIGIQLILLSVSCGVGTQARGVISCQVPTPKGLFFVSSITDIPGEIEKGLREAFRDVLVFDDDEKTKVNIDKTFLKVASDGLPLKTGLSASLGLDFRAALALLKAENCPSSSDFDIAKSALKANVRIADEALADLQQSLDKIALGPDGKGITFTVPLAPYASVVNFKVGATFGLPLLKLGTTSDSTGVTFTFFAPKFTLKSDIVVTAAWLKGLADNVRKLLTVLGKVNDIIYAGYKARKLLEIVLTLKDLKVIGTCVGGSGSSSAGGLGGRRGTKQAPGVSGSPDDRLDAFRTELFQSPAGAAGELQTLQRKLQIANERGYARAAAYYTNIIRRLEYAQFVSDAEAQQANQSLINARVVQAADRVQGIISGTIAITAGQTITSAVGDALLDLYANGLDTPFNRESLRLSQAVDFAERQYMSLLGQELDLQIELGRIDNFGIGILNDGLANFAAAAVGTLGYDTVFVNLFPGTGGIVPDAASFTPFDAPPVLLVPSGGLYPYAGNSAAKTWLEQYVAAGGMLIVLAQYENSDWEMLPGGKVRGLGYRDDILCKDASVRIINPSELIVGIDHDLPNIQIDGSFTQFPDNTTVVLQRTTGNLMPAMIEYPFGNGRVVATSAYPDFYINGMQSADDVAFARSIFGIAYLNATEKQVATSAPVNGQVRFNVLITNTSTITASGLTIHRDYYDTRIAESWRWAAHAPAFRTVGTSTQPLTPPLAPNESREVELAFQAPPQAGLFRAAAVLYASEGRFSAPIAGAIPTDLYQVRGAGVPIDRFNAILRTQPNGYAYGTQAVLTATLRNDRPSPRTIVLSTELGLPASVLTVTIPASSTLFQPYTTTALATHDVRIAIRENNQTLSALIGALKVRRPSVLTGLLPDAIAPGTVTPLTITVAALDVAPGTPLRLDVSHGSTAFFSETRVLSEIGASAPVTFNLSLPPLDPGESVRVSATLLSPLCSDLVCANVRTMKVGRAGEAIALVPAAPLVLGADTPDAVRAILLSSGRPTGINLRATLEAGVAGTATGPATRIETSDLSADTLVTVSLPARLPANAPINLRLDSVSTAQGAAQSYTTTYSVEFNVSADAVVPQGEGFRSGSVLLATLAPLRINSQQGFAPNVQLSPNTVFSLTLDAPSGEQWLLTASPVFRNGRYELAFGLPELRIGGFYQASVDTSALEGYGSTFGFYVAPQRLSLEAPQSVAAGSAVSLTVRNSGGVSTTLAGQLLLRPAGAAAITATDGISLIIPAQGATTLNYTIPGQLAAGPYLLQLAGIDHLGQAVTATARVDLAGLSVTLDARTERVAYTASDIVTATVAVTTSAALAGATLRLRVTRPAPVPTDAGGSDNWLADAASAGRVNRNNNRPPAVLPQTAVWTSPHAGNFGNVLSVNGAIVTADLNNGRVRALNEASGQLLWEFDYTTIEPFGLQGFAANSSTIFLLFNQRLAALNAATGAVRWIVNAGGNLSGSPLVNDTALAVQQSTGGGGTTQLPQKAGGAYAKPIDQLSSDDGYILIDPNSGVQRGSVAAFSPGLLVGNALIYMDSSNSQLSAADAVTGAPLWSSTVDAFLAPVAADLANTVFYDSSSGALKVFATQTGALLRTIAVDSAYNPNFRQGAVLNGNDLRIGLQQFDVNGPLTLVYAINLTDGAQSTVYSATASFVGLAGADDATVVVQVAPQAAIVLNAAGETVSSLDLSGLGTVAGVIAGRYGLLVASSDVIVAHVIAPDASAAQVLYDATLPLDGAGVISIAHVLQNLAANPAARGALLLNTEVTSAAPFSQSLARASAGFAINDSATGLTLVADSAIVRQNRPAYADDDARAALALRGTAVNSGALAQDIALTVIRDDGVVVYSRTLAAVPAGASVDFTVTDAEAPAGVVTYTAASSLGTIASTQVVVQPGSATADAQSDEAATGIALGESVTVRVRLVNTRGDIDSVVSLSWGDGARDVVLLAPSEARAVSHIYTPTAPGLFTPALQASGDATAIAGASPISVRDERVAASLDVTGRTRDDVLINDGAVAASLVLTNPFGYAIPVRVDYVINSDPISGSQAYVLNAGSEQILTVPLAPLPAGAHRATFTVTHARLGALIGAFERLFVLAAPQNAVDLSITSGEPDAAGVLPVGLSVNAAAGNDTRLDATLVTSGAINVAQSLAIAPGEVVALSLPVNLSTLSGAQPLYVSVLAANGQLLAQRAVTVQGPTNPAPKAVLVGLTATPASAGGAVQLRATVRNDGVAGDAEIEFNAFEGRVVVAVPVPANAVREVSATLPVPAGILSGIYPAFAVLGASQASTDVIVSAPKLALQVVLDQPVYGANTNGVVRARLQGVSGAAQQYDVAFRYRTGESLQTITLGAGDARELTWSFDVGQASDRLNVIVSNHTEAAPGGGMQPRYSVAIDSAYVNVIEDDRLWIETDKTRYVAGEVVRLTLHAVKPVQDVFVLAPYDMPQAGQFLVWSDLSLLDGLDALTPTLGSYTAVYTLPAAVATGRYFFTVLYGEDERLVPIDVFGASVQVERTAVVLSQGIVNIDMNVRSNMALTGARIVAHAIAPDGAVVQLGASADVSLNLAAGATPVHVSGTLNGALPGQYRIIVRMLDSAGLAEFAGASAFVQVGRSAIASLSTDRGVYAPGQPGLGTITVYGNDSASRITVTTSDGSVLVDTQRALQGFATLTFSVPTAVERDELLIGKVIGSDSMTSTLLAPYRVAAAFDTEAPSVEISSPSAATVSQTIRVVLTGSESRQLVVSGVVTDASRIDSVTVNGVTATLDATGAGTAYSATVPITTGVTFVDVVARDRHGNTGFATISVSAEPDLRLLLSASPTRTQASESVLVRAVLTSTETTSATVLFGEEGAVLGLLPAQASNGQFATVDGVLRWSGLLDAVTPVELLVTATVLLQPGPDTTLLSTVRVTETVDGVDSLYAARSVEVYAAATPTPTPTSTPTATATPTDTPTATATATSTPSNTPTATATATSTPSNTPTATATATSTPSNTPTATATATSTPSNTPTATATPTPTAAPTSTATPTSTPSNTPTATATPTPTTAPTSTATSTSTPSNTPTATATPTPTSVPSNTPTTTDTPSSGAVDLVIDVSDARQALLPGGVMVYRLFYANLGTAPAMGVRISETVPANSRFVLAQSVTGWSCPDASAAGSVCQLNIGTLAPGARGSAAFAVLHNGAQSPISITSTAQIAFSGPDSNASNNVSSAVTPLVLTGGQAISPVLECVMDRGASANPRFAAVFGYNNPNAFAKAIGVGASNKFSPTPQYRGQPAVFLPGRRLNVFYVNFNSGSLVWTLNGKTSTASTSSSRCAGTLTLVGGTVYLDADDDGLRDGLIAEPGLPLIEVQIVDAAGRVLDARYSGLDGTYAFVIDGKAGKSVRVIRPALTGLRFSTRDANAASSPGNDPNDSAIDPATWQTDVLSRLPNALERGVNAALRQ